MNHAPPNRLEDLDWFHPDVNRHAAESMLLHNGIDGTYLLRLSSNPQEQYVLSIRCNQSVKHFPVTWTGEHYKFGMVELKSVAEFLNHFANQPLISGESGQVTLLKFPYPRCIDEPKMYDTVRVHAEFSTGDTGTERPNFSVNSKEGFLTKVGAYFKTWKTRWFVLQKNELKYYKIKMDKEPIRVLDLNECTECAKDDTHKEKSNVFKVVFSWRTFYLYASTDVEADEWIKLINWRLKSKKSSLSH